MCSFRRKRRNLANQEENDQQIELGPLAVEGDNQPIDNNGVRNDGAYEFDPDDGEYEPVVPARRRENQQGGNNREEFDTPAEQPENHQSSCRIVLNKDFNNRPISLRGTNKNTEDNQERENSAGNDQQQVMRT